LISIVTNKLTKRPFDDNKYLTVLFCYWSILWLL